MPSDPVLHYKPTVFGYEAKKYYGHFSEMAGKIFTGEM